jgi:probable phosphoglycerate mutase
MQQAEGMILLLARHGRTALNQAGRFRGRAPISLDELGRQQAARLAARVGTLCGPGGRYPAPIAVGSSPLPRALETARPLAAATGAPLRVFDGLADLDYGAWEGRTPAEAQAADPTLYARWQRNPARVPVPNGESLGALQARTVAVLERCRAEGGPGSCWILVAHDVVWRVVFCWALGLPLTRRDQFGQDPAALNILWLPGDPAEPPVLDTLNDIGHLQGLADPAARERE